MFVAVKLRVIADETGLVEEMPGLLTEAGVLMPLVDYFNSKRARSISWKRKVRFAVELFLEYLLANPREQDKRELFINFAARLESGTFGPNHGEGLLALGWHSRSSSESQSIITNLTDLFIWLSVDNGEAGKFNPPSAGNAFDNAIARAAYTHRREKALLGHMWNRDMKKPRSVRSKPTPNVSSAHPPAFPEDRFLELLNEGFMIGNRYDYRGILITLLLHGAGFRESEPMHLYIEDVVSDPLNPKSALVRIHHPSASAAPADWRDAAGRPRKGNRADYLAQRYGLHPRTLNDGTRRAGWKGGHHDEKYYKTARWFPTSLGELFLTVWKKYLRQVAMFNRTHPYAFINIHREPYGEVYQIKQFEKAHAAACRRIGLPVAKEYGTTPHGHRHAYGRRLSAAGIAPVYIRTFLHQSSEASQQVYTTPSEDETMQAIKEGEAKLRQEHLLRVVPADFLGMKEND